MNFQLHGNSVNRHIVNQPEQEKRDMEKEVKEAWEMRAWKGMEMQREKITWKNCLSFL